MAEIAPGLFVSDLIEHGDCYVLNLPLLGIGDRKAVALSWQDWDRIDPVERERLADMLTREAAERVISEFQKLMARAPALSDTEKEAPDG